MYSRMSWKRGKNRTIKVISLYPAGLVAQVFQAPHRTQSAVNCRVMFFCTCLIPLEGEMAALGLAETGQYVR